MITEHNLESAFKKLKKNKDNAESSDDVEDRDYLMQEATKR